MILTLSSYCLKKIKDLNKYKASSIISFSKSNTDGAGPRIFVRNGNKAKFPTIFGANTNSEW